MFDSFVRDAVRLGVAAAVAAGLTMWALPSDRAAGSDGFFGMVVGPEIDVTEAVPRLGELGVHTVRLRTDVRDWGRPQANAVSQPYDSALAQAGPLADRGFRVILQVYSEGGAMPSYRQARGVFEWMLRRPGADAVDVVEVFGPVTETASNADAYSTTLSRAEQARRYVTGPLKAAWDVFHEADKRVLGGAFTRMQQRADFRSGSAVGMWVTEAYVRAGYLRYVDYAGVQLYTETAAGQRTLARRFADVLDRTPIWVSEWGLIRNVFPDAAAYSRAMTAAQAALRRESTIDVVCYAGFTAASGADGVTREGLGGYRPVQPAFDTYRTWTR